MKCPRCNADVPPGNLFCGICGQPVAEATSPEPAPAKPTATCANCGAELVPGDRFCGKCGQAVDADEATLEPGSYVPPLEEFAVPRRKRPGWMWLLLGAAAVCVVCVVGAIVVAASPNLRSSVFGLLERTPTRIHPPTPEPTHTPVEMDLSPPAPTADPTATPSRTAALTPTPTETALRAAFAGDVTIPDNTILEPGQRFGKTWRLQNSGDRSWPEGVRLVYVTGDNIGDYASDPLDRAIEPGEEVEITIPMTAPSEPGTYKGSWQMRTPEGDFFGAKLFVVIQVAMEGDEEGPTPTGTVTLPATTPQAVEKELVFEHAWGRNWIGIENRGVWARASDGHQYATELGLIATEEALAEIERSLPAGRRAKVVIRRKVAWVACTTDICQKQSRADDGQITHEIYLSPAAWSSLVDAHLAGDWQAMTENPVYIALQKAVFGSIGQTPDLPCIAFKFILME